MDEVDIKEKLKGVRRELKIIRDKRRELSKDYTHYKVREYELKDKLTHRR